MAFALACSTASATVYFEDTFDAGIGEQWKMSSWKGADMGKIEWSAGEWFGDEAKAKGMQM